MTLPMSSTGFAPRVSPRVQDDENTRKIMPSVNLLPIKHRIANDVLRRLSAQGKRKGKVQSIARECFWSSEETGDLIADLAVAGVAAYTALRSMIQNTLEYSVLEADKLFREILENKAA